MMYAFDECKNNSNQAFSNTCVTCITACAMTYAFNKCKETGVWTKYKAWHTLHTLITLCSLHTVRTRCTVNQFSLNMIWTIVSARTQQTLISLYWKNAKNAGNKRAVHKHEETWLHSAQNYLCACAKKQQILGCGEWYLNHSQMVQRMLAVPSTHACIWYAVWFAINPFLHSLVCIVFVDEAHLINNSSMSKYKLTSSRMSGIKYDFPPLEIYIFVNLPSNWKVIQ